MAPLTCALFTAALGCAAAAACPPLLLRANLEARFVLHCGAPAPFATVHGPCKLYVARVLLFPAPRSGCCAGSEPSCIRCCDDGVAPVWSPEFAPCVSRNRAALHSTCQRLCMHTACACNVALAQATLLSSLTLGGYVAPQSFRSSTFDSLSYLPPATHCSATHSAQVHFVERSKLLFDFAQRSHARLREWLCTLQACADDSRLLQSTAALCVVGMYARLCGPKSPGLISDRFGGGGWPPNRAHAILMHKTHASHGTVSALAVCTKNSPALQSMPAVVPGTVFDMPVFGIMVHLQQCSSMHPNSACVKPAFMAFQLACDFYWQGHAPL